MISLKENSRWTYSIKQFRGPKYSLNNNIHYSNSIFLAMLQSNDKFAEKCVEWYSIHFYGETSTLAYVLYRICPLVVWNDAHWKFQNVFSSHRHLKIILLKSCNRWQKVLKSVCVRMGFAIGYVAQSSLKKDLYLIWI